MIERVHSWINRFRRMPVRWEKKPRTTRLCSSSYTLHPLIWEKWPTWDMVKHGEFLRVIGWQEIDPLTTRILLKEGGTRNHTLVTLPDLICHAQAILIDHPAA